MLEEEILRRVLEAGLSGGADLSEVFVERRRSNALRLESSRVEDIASGYEEGAGVRVIAGDRATYAYTNVLSEEALVEAARAAAAAAGGSGRDVADLRRVAPAVVNVVERSPHEVPAEDKVGALTAADDAARATGADVAQVIATYADVHQEVLIAASDGLLAGDDRTRVRMAVQVVASRNGTITTGFDAPGHSGGFELLDVHAPQEIASKAATKALKMLDARPCPAGEFPVVLAPGTGGVLIHEACGHGLEGDTIVKDASVYANRRGERFGAEFVTIVDDGSDAGAWGSFGVDDEGTPSQRTVLFDQGVLVGELRDRRSAHRLGRPPSGNGRRQSYAHLPIVRMTNTYLLPGTDDPREVIASVKDGVYAGTFAGGEVNPATGNFVFGMSEAYWISNGEIAYPIKGGTLIGNGPDVLGAIEVIGNDFGRTEGVCGKDGQHAPVTNGMATVLLRKMTVGGTEA